MIFRRIPNVMSVFAGAALLVGTSALAQMHPAESAPQTTNPSANPNGVGTTDAMQQQQTQSADQMQSKAFVRKAMEGGMAEVELGKLAQEKGSSQDVKQFGEQMVTDHSKLNDQMQQVAQQLGVAPPTHLSKKDQETKAKLESLSGAQFDDAYIRTMLKDHKKDASEFKEEAARTQDPALQQATQQGGQVIGQHLQMIEQIAQSHNISTEKGKNSAGS
jgi:putative membrane protein